MRSIFELGAQHRLAARLAEQRRSLFRLASMWCHDRSLADDLTQEALTKALARVHQLRDPERLRPWLYGILVNCWRDHLRSRRPAEDIESIDERSLALPDVTESSASHAQLVARVRACVARLPTAQCEVLALVDLEGCTYAEVAEILAIPAGTVMSRLCRARAALREMLAEGHSEAAGLRRVK